jgi:hypothetical protein
MIVVIPVWLNLSCVPAVSRNMVLRIIAASMLRQIVAPIVGLKLGWKIMPRIESIQQCVAGDDPDWQ